MDDFVTVYERMLSGLNVQDQGLLDAAARGVRADHPHELRLLGAREAFLRMTARLTSDQPDLVRQAKDVAHEVRQGRALVALSTWRNHLIVVPIEPLAGEITRLREG